MRPSSADDWQLATDYHLLYLYVVPTLCLFFSLR